MNEKEKIVCSFLFFFFRFFLVFRVWVCCCIFELVLWRTEERTKYTSDRIDVTKTTEGTPERCWCGADWRIVWSKQAANVEHTPDYGNCECKCICREPGVCCWKQRPTLCVYLKMHCASERYGDASTQIFPSARAQRTNAWVQSQTSHSKLKAVGCWLLADVFYKLDGRFRLRFSHDASIAILFIFAHSLLCSFIN